VGVYGYVYVCVCTQPHPPLITQALVRTLGETKTHFIRCVKPNMVKKPNTFVDDVMMRQLYTSGVVQAVQATRKGFPDHLPFAELINRYYIVLPKDAKALPGAAGVKALLKVAEVPEAEYRIGKTKVTTLLSVHNLIQICIVGFG